MTNKLPHIKVPKDWQPLTIDKTNWEFYDITEEDVNEHKILKLFKERNGTIRALIHKDHSKIRIDNEWGDSILYDLKSKKIITQGLGF